MTYDSNVNKVVFAFKNQGNNNYGESCVGTVSGSAITFGSTVVFNSSVITDVEATFDSNANKVVFVYPDGYNGQYYPTAIVGTVTSGAAISFGTKVVINTVAGSNTAIAFDSTAKSYGCLPQRH